MKIFFKKKEPSILPIQVDIHSHLLPGIDDGVKSFEESMYILKQMEKLGYKKIITTPHIMHDYYPNTAKIIKKKLSELDKHLKEEDIQIQIEAAAEYFIDEFFINTLEKKEDLLTLNKEYILIETAFFNKPSLLNDVIFKLQSIGLKVILAHPERYLYLADNKKLIHELKERNVYFQLNLNSLTGYYNKGVQKLAHYLIKEKLVNFAGTDCHNLRHMEILKKTTLSKKFKQLTQLNLLNNTL